MKKQGKLIVIEGIDGSGKKTQFELLVKYLKSRKMAVETVDFPRYKQSVWGKLLKELLAGRLGDFQQVTPYVSVLPYVLDQRDWWQKIGREAMDKGKIILANRYVTSNVHQIYKLKGNKRNKFAKWFWGMVYEELELPRPSLVLVLDVKPVRAAKLMKAREKDRADEDWGYQQAAYQGYKQMSKRYQNWVLVKCVEAGKLLTKEKISERIGKIYEKFTEGGS